LFAVALRENFHKTNGPRADETNSILSTLARTNLAHALLWFWHPTFSGTNHELAWP